MSLLRNNKIINKNPVIKHRNKKLRSSDDAKILFYPVDQLIYMNLPTKESVLNFYFYKQKQNFNKPAFIKTIAQELNHIWINFIKTNHLSISLVTARQIETIVEKLINDWQTVQKNINRQVGEVKEAEFMKEVKFILNCAKREDKSFFACEDENLNVHNLPRGEFNTFYDA